MESKNYVYASLDDVIFEGRNRAYGAYVLRKIYNENLGKGLALAIAVFILFLSIPLVVNKLWPTNFIIPTQEKITPAEPMSPEIFEAKPVQPPAQPAGPVSPVKPTVTDNLPTVIKKDNEIKNEPKTTVTPPGTETGATNNAGGGTDPGVDGPAVPTTSTGSSAIPSNEAVTWAEKQPEFPGGQEALHNYLSKNTRFTETAKRLHLSGLVVVSFVVNYEGNITDIKVLKGLGGGLDEEAIRAVKSMPRWQPGSNNGKPVNVRFNLPIRFNLAQ